MPDLDHQQQIEAAWQEHVGWRSSRPSWRNPRTRQRLAEAQNWRCCWSGCVMDDVPYSPRRATFDHIVPKALGGPDVLENVAMACHDCNVRRPSTLGELYRIAALLDVEDA